MTKEEKQLLIKDLCARLPYRINVLTEDNDKGHIIGVDDTENGVFEIHIIEDGDSYTYDESIENFKPYLRPMSSMTYDESGYYNIHIEELSLRPNAINAEELITWLIENHFDYHNLIPMGLALEAPEDMYKNK